MRGFIIFLIKKLYTQHLFKFLIQLSLNATQFSSIPQSCPTQQPHEPQHARPPCPSPTPRAYSNSCPLSRWCHPTISSSVVPFSVCLQSFPALGSFQMSQFFASGGQILELQLQHQSFQWIFRADFLICLTPSFYPHISN